MRTLKDKHRESVRLQIIEEERQEKLRMIKQGGAQELLVLNSFEKQSQEIQFIEHMSKYYNNLSTSQTKEKS